MAVSLVNFVREKSRQKLADDDDFLRRYLYFFEMRVPHDMATAGAFIEFLFPIILPPQSYTMTEPFSVEATPTQGGGLYVEENGIVQRSIRLRGTTGFRPRPLKVTEGDAFPAILDTGQKSHGRELPSHVFTKISGQRHMQYLQDAVFRTYADLKRDPSTAAETKLIFHNPKDRESWIVVPREFTLEQDSGAPHLYTYSIDLLVVGPADAVKADFSEDKGIFDSIKDVLRMMKKGADLIAGAINDLTALVGEIKSVLNTIDTLIDAATAIVDAVTDFANGVSELVEIPYTFVESTTALAEAGRAAVNAFNELGEGQGVPSGVDQKLATLQDGLELVGAFPASYERTLDGLLREKREQQEQRRSVSDDRKEEALEFGSPTTFDAVRNLGTQLTAGDVQSAEGQLTIGGLVRKFKSAREVQVEDGDTMASLAARYMGDARQWQYVAILNGLKPPFIDSQASAPLVAGVGTGSTTSGRATGADENPFSKVLGVGSKILIPTNQRSALDLPLLPVMGVKTDESAEVQFLGTDLELAVATGLSGSSRALYDIPIDTEKGSVDAKMISGIDNMAQAVVIRLLTDRGTDSLYKNLGVHRIVSLNFTSLDLAIARFRVVDAIASDARVSAVHLIRFSQGDENDGLAVASDQLRVDLTVGVRGFSESRPIQVLL